MDINSFISSPFGMFILGAGSTGSIAGTLLLWRVKKTWTDIDAIPGLVKAVTELTKTVNTFSGELKTIERMLYAGQTDLAVAQRDLKTAFKLVDETRRELKDYKS